MNQSKMYYFYFVYFPKRVTSRNYTVFIKIKNKNYKKITYNVNKFFLKMNGFALFYKINDKQIW